MTAPQSSARRASLLLLIVFAAIYSACAENTTLRCTRAADECVLTQERPLSTRTVTFKVADLLGVQSEWTGTQKRGAVRTILDTRQGAIELQVWHSNRGAYDSAHIREFLANPRQPEVVVTNDTRLGTLVPASFLPIAAALLFG